jgi:hypothetical protein
VQGNRYIACGGCPRACRYSDLKTGITWDDAWEMARARRAEAEARNAYGEDRVNRATVLWFMHETKRELWLEFIGSCLERPRDRDTELEFDMREVDVAPADLPSFADEIFPWDDPSSTSSPDEVPF